MRRTTWISCLAVAVATCLSGNVGAVVITLTEPFQPGDYAYWGSESSEFYQVRPSAAGGSVLTQLGFSDTAGAGGTNPNVAGTFAPNGDYFYISGDLNGLNRQGRELRKIPVGQTASVDINLNIGSNDTGADYTDLVVASDGTIFLSREGSGSVVRLVPGDNYDMRTSQPFGSPTTPANKGTLELSPDERFLIKTGNNNAGMDVIATDFLSPAVNYGGTGFARPTDVAFDVANGEDANGNLRLVVANGSSVDGIGGTITELLYNVATGVVSNPFDSGGGGNLANANALILGNGGQVMDMVEFDNDDNLVATLRHTGNVRSFTQAELDGPFVNHDDGTLAWAFNAWAPISFEIAPAVIPEPGALALALVGLLGFCGMPRRKGC